MYLAGAVFTLAVRVSVLLAARHGSRCSIWLAIVLGVNVGHDLMYGPQAAFFSELFGTRVRYSGASLGYQLASVLRGGFAPLIAAALLAANGGDAVCLSRSTCRHGRDHGRRDRFARETYRTTSSTRTGPQERRFFREGEGEAKRPRPAAQPVGR